MIKNRNIPLIQASVIESFILVAREIGTPVEQTLITAGLPAAMLDTTDLIVPERPAWKFSQKMAPMEDAPYWVCEQPLHWHIRA